MNYYVETDTYENGEDNPSAHSHTATTTNTSVGSGSSHENRPPYYALCYIMKISN